ncbi:hypothetical protein VF04_36550 [Nostoc linckia z7]|uniref:Uncharacterized protein n=2 Tax=Nostoc linckia TaxID=92942 RepID=A0A9Q5Z5B0_NOSLI|nr:hypothetical protein [Nostoc linckia]PHJ81997.1 hypothetical protein VF07_29350 [Nostoc linckia z6]PHJ83734.1 hypothetical protein VF04_36550 [Nostoc linckia z7]PHJ94034.1 hypothetical protein VF08_34460 [Nostoc linckia z8]
MIKEVEEFFSQYAGKGHIWPDGLDVTQLDGNVAKIYAVLPAASGHKYLVKGVDSDGDQGGWTLKGVFLKDGIVSRLDITAIGAPKPKLPERVKMYQRAHKKDFGDAPPRWDVSSYLLEKEYALDIRHLELNIGDQYGLYDPVTGEITDIRTVDANTPIRDE